MPSQESPSTSPHFPKVEEGIGETVPLRSARGHSQGDFPSPTSTPRREAGDKDSHTMSPLTLVDWQVDSLPLSHQGNPSGLFLDSCSWPRLQEPWEGGDGRSNNQGAVFKTQVRRRLWAGPQLSPGLGGPDGFILVPQGQFRSLVFLL